MISTSALRIESLLQMAPRGVKKASPELIEGKWQEEPTKMSQPTTPLHQPQATKGFVRILGAFFLLGGGGWSSSAKAGTWTVSFPCAGSPLSSLRLERLSKSTQAGSKSALADSTRSASNSVEKHPRDLSSALGFGLMRCGQDRKRSWYREGSALRITRIMGASPESAESPRAMAPDSPTLPAAI